MEIVNKAAVDSLVICLAENDFIASPPKFRNKKSEVLKLCSETKRSKLVFRACFCYLT